MTFEWQDLDSFKLLELKECQNLQMKIIKYCCLKRVQDSEFSELYIS